MVSSLRVFLHIREHKRGTRLSTVETIVVPGHETSHTSNWTVFSQTGHLVVLFYPVILQRLQRNGLARALDLLGLCEDLLFTLLSSTAETEHKVECALFLDIVVGEGPSIFELLPCEDKTLLIRRNSLLVLDLGLHVVDRIGRLDIECDCFTREGLDEDLHGDRYRTVLW